MMIQNTRSGMLVAVLFSVALFVGCDSSPNSREAKITGTVPTDDVPTQSRREAAKGTGDSVKAAGSNAGSAPSSPRRSY